MSETEMRSIDLAMLYELRLIIKESEKENYSKDELMEFLDQVAISKK